MTQYESCIVKAFGLHRRSDWRSDPYYEGCVQAAIAQGLGPIVAEAQARGLNIAIDQTGGMTMVAYINTNREGYALNVIDDDEGIPDDQNNYLVQEHHEEIGEVSIIGRKLSAAKAVDVIQAYLEAEEVSP